MSESIDSKVEVKILEKITASELQQEDPENAEEIVLKNIIERGVQKNNDEEN